MNSLFKQSCRKNKTWKVDDSRGNPTYFSFMYVRENARAHTYTHTYRHAQGQCWDCTGDRIFSKLFCFTNFHLDRNMLKATPMCAHNPQVVKFQFSHLLLLASSADKVTTSKSKQRRGVTHTHTHQSTCMQATLISRPSIPRFFHIYFPASFALLWCIIEAVCNFTSSFLAESV